MRIVYLGSSAFAVQVLRALVASAHRPLLVVTPPDRPKGRGRKVSPPAAALAARALGLELFQTANVNDEDTLGVIEGKAPQAVCACEFGQLIKEPLLSGHLILNVHPSLLPRWRGAAPIERALMAGDRESGVTIFKITAGLDCGPIALAASEPVLADDNAGSLSSRLAALGGRLLVEALDRAQAGTLELVEQSDDGATYADKIEAGERRLDAGRPAAELAQIVRALTPHVGAYLSLVGGQRLGISTAQVAGESLEPGEMRVWDGRLLVGCSEDALELLEVTPPGRRAMSAQDYLRGHRPPQRVEP